MADKSSTPYTNRKSLTDAREYGGNDLLIRLNWTVASDANGDRIFMCELPLNCQVVDGAICWDALGASTTMAIGDQTSGTRYLAATAVTTAGRVSFPTPRAGMNYRPVIAADRVLCVTWGGATPTNAAVIEGWVRVQLGS
jgi:hypothetical protein